MTVLRLRSKEFYQGGGADPGSRVNIEKWSQHFWDDNVYNIRLWSSMVE